MENKGESKDSNPMILVYWKVRGIAQPLRHLLQYIGAPYVDQIAQCPHKFFTEQVDEYKKKCGSNDLPVLKDGTLTISQPVAIIKYICKKHGLVDLLGKSIVQQCQIDQFLIQFMQHRRLICDVLKSFIRQAQEVKEPPAEKVNDSVQKLNSRFWQTICKIYQDKQWAMGYLTVVDFFLYDTVFYISGFFPIMVAQQPGILKFKERFQSLEAIKEYQSSSRERLIIFPVAVGKLWHGSARYK